MASLGSSLGSALGMGINQLAELKLAEMTQKYERAQEKANFNKNWKDLLGENAASRLSEFSPEERNHILNSPGLLLKFNPKQNINEQSALGNLLTQQQPEQEQYSPQQQLQSALGQYFNNPTMGHQNPLQQNYGQQGGGLEQLYQPQQVPNQPQQEQQGQGQITPEIAQEIAGMFSTPEQRLARQKEAHQSQVEADKETKKYFESALDLEKAADFSDIRLKKMENLIKKGGLPISGFYNLFKDLEEKVPATYGAAAGGAAGAYAGGPVGAFVGSVIGGLLSPVGTMLRFAQKHTSPNTEEFEKLSNDFIKDAKAIFGSRITDRDLIAFMATVPTLGQTDAGKLAIINNMKMFNRASRIRAEAVKDVIRENGNRRPHNLQILVEDKIRPQLDQLAEEFSVV